jgi:hypothetical protein
VVRECRRRRENRKQGPETNYIRILDGNGTELINYTGTFRRGVTTPCISTSSVKVVLDADPAVVAQGFIVDAAVACP